VDIKDSVIVFKNDIGDGNIKIVRISDDRDGDSLSSFLYSFDYLRDSIDNSDEFSDILEKLEDKYMDIISEMCYHLVTKYYGVNEKYVVGPPEWVSKGDKLEIEIEFAVYEH